MSTAIGYGKSFAQKHLDAGDFAAALTAADEVVARDEADPEPVMDRAQALLGLDRFEDAVTATLRAIELDREARILEDAVVDDTLFTALVRWGQAIAPARPDDAVALFARYRAALPKGVHVREIDEWTRRFRGEKSTWVKAT